MSTSHTPVHTVIDNPFPASRYHAQRMRDAWFRFVEHCDNERPEFEGDFSETMEILGNWADGRHLNELDQHLLANIGEDTEAALDTMLSDPGKWGVVLDATGLPDLNSETLLDDRFPHFPKNMKRAALYIHLGKDAFPSPYGDVGVEGVYLEIDVRKRAAKDPINIVATVVCSETPYPDGYGNRGLSVNAGLHMRDQLRNGATSFYSFGEDDLASQIEYAISERDPSAAAWAPYMSRPITAALNAAHLCFGGLVPAHDAIPGLTDIEKAKASRASNEEFFRVAPEFGQERFCVRFLGEAPAQKATSRRRTGAPYIRSPRNVEEVNIAIDDAFDQTSPEDAMIIMRAVRDAAYSRREDSDADRLAWIRSCVALLQAELHADDTGSALRSAQLVSDLAHDHPPAEPYLPLAWLAMELIGFEDEAARIEARLDKDAWIDSMEAIRAIRGMLGDPNDLSSLMENGVQRPFSMKFIESMLPYGIATPNYCAEWHYGQADMHDVQMWLEEDLGARGLK